jgi:hypothetical protein
LTRIDLQPHKDALSRRTAIVWVGLIVVAIALAIHGVTHAGGEPVYDVLENWVSDAAVWTVAIMCLVAAVRTHHNRAAWFLVATALVLWAIGDTLWSLRGDPDAITSISDVFWLAWYPLIVAALVLLVRDRVPGFELHRWIDGVVVMLVVATPWVALFLQPAAERSSANALADAVDFAYPLGDAIVVGATLGVLALMGWRAGPMWTALCAGFATLALADAIYSVDVLGHSYNADTSFDAVWLAGIMLVAYAAWLPHPGRLEPVRVTGWRAVALPLAAQAFAIIVQLISIFVEVPPSDSILTIVVLLIAMVQIVITRPRGDDDAAAARAASAGPVVEVHGAVAEPALVEQLEPDPRVVGE